MKFVVNNTDLSYAVNATCKAADKDGGITVIAKNDKVTFVTNNKIMTIETTIKAEVFEEGKATVPAKIFLNTVSKISSSDITLSAEENGSQVSFKYDTGELKIAVLGNDYSAYIKNDKVSSGFKIKFAEYKKIVDVISRYAATDNARPILTGVNMKSIGDLLIATACDGYKLANRIIDAEPLKKEQDDINIIVPVQALQTIYSLTDKKAEKIQVSLANNNNLFIFEQEGLKITVALIGGQYLDSSRIIPTEFRGTVTADKTALSQSVERSTITGSEMVVFDIDDESIAVSSNSESGMLNERIKATLTGETFGMAFNAKWLLEMFKNCDEDNITMSLSGKVSPMVIKEDKQLFLLLPIRRAEVK